MSVIVSPDCRDQNHQKCPGDAWDEAHDHPTECECECHGGPVGAEHFPLCPCGACQNVRAARPVTHAMQAKHLSGASIGKLVEWEVGRSILTNEHQWSPAALLDTIEHEEGVVTLTIDWGNDGDYDGWHTEAHDLTPDDWVRITTQPATAGILLPETKENS